MAITYRPAGKVDSLRIAELINMASDGVGEFLFHDLVPNTHLFITQTKALQQLISYDGEGLPAIEKSGCFFLTPFALTITVGSCHFSASGHVTCLQTGVTCIGRREECLRKISQAAAVRHRSAIRIRCGFGRHAHPSAGLRKPVRFGKDTCEMAVMFADGQV